MSTVRVSLIQSPVSSNVPENLNTASAMVREAARSGAQIICLPEMFCCPYNNTSFVLHQEPAGGRIWNALREMARTSRVWLIGGTFPEAEKQRTGNPRVSSRTALHHPAGEEEQQRIYNTAYVFDPEGEQIARHRKIHLFDVDIRGGQRFKESDVFTAGDEITVFDTPFARIGLEICFDIRFEEQTRRMALDGADLVFVPASFNMTTGPAHWELLLRARAVDNQLFLCGCAAARNEQSSYVSYGNSLVTSPWGDIVGRLDEKPGILTLDLDLNRIAEVREQLPLLKARRSGIDDVIRCESSRLSKKTSL